MSGWHTRLVIAVVAGVLLLTVLVATHSPRTDMVEPGRDRPRVQVQAAPHAPSKPAWSGADPIADGGSRPRESEIDGRRTDLGEVTRAGPLGGAAPGTPSGSPSGRGTVAGGAAEKPADDVARRGEATKRSLLSEAATASGVAPRFAAFGQGAGGGAIGSTPSEQENVDFSSAPGAYFSPDAILGFPGRGGLQVEAGTVMFWLQPVDWDGADNHSYSFFLLRDIHSLDHHFAILKNGSSLRFQIVNADDVEFDLFWPIAEWQRGEWHHVAATWSDSLMDLWVDGALVGEQNIDGLPSVQPNSPAYWGSNRGTFGAGAILADGRIFDSVLPASDIETDAQRVPR